MPKERVTVQIDTDLIKWFQAQVESAAHERLHCVSM